MATFVNDLRLTELATGEGSGTWGTTTNQNLSLLGEAFSFGTEAITTNADTHTTTIADGSTDPGRSLFLKYTGALDSACTITIGPNTVSKLWFIENATSGSQNIIIKQGSGSTITIPNGQTKAIYSDGAGSGGAMVDAFQDLSIPDLFIDDDLTIGDDLVFSSDSAVITFGADGDTTLTHTDGSGLTLNSTNKLMFNDASQFIQGSSATVLSLGATDEIDLTATAIDVNGTIDVSGNATLGGTLGVTGAVTANAGISIDNITIDGTEIDLSSGDLTLDVAGDIILDADGGDIRFRDGGTEVGVIVMDDGSNTFILKAAQSDADIKFNGNDGGSGITALTLDMSDAGAAIFNGHGTFNDTVTINSTSSNALTIAGTGGGINFTGGNNRVNFTSNRALEGATDGSTLTVGEDYTTIRLSGAVVANESGADADFRVESDGNTHALFVDAGNNRVQFGKSSGGNTNTAGVEIQTSGFVGICGDDFRPVQINRQTSDGDIIEFRKDGTKAGSIGAYSGDITIGTGDTGLTFEDAANVIHSVNSTSGAARDAAIDLGKSASRFKDLYISGGINNGTNAIAFSGGAFAGDGSGNDANIDLGRTNRRFQNLYLSGGIPGTASGELVINENSADSDFRVESDANTHALFVDAGNGTVNINTSSGAKEGSAGGIQLQIAQSSATAAQIFFDGSSADRGYVIGTVSNDYIIFNETSSGVFKERLSISDSEQVFNQEGQNVDFRVEGEGNANCLLVDASANAVMVGKSDSGDFNVAGMIIRATGEFIITRNGDVATFNRISTNGDLLRFRRDNSTVGSISVTTSATTYSTTSDRRLKTNIVDAPSASEDIDAIQVRSFDWKADGVHQKYGVIAQELESVAPSAVDHGDKEDDLMGVDYSKLVPMLIKEIQSLRNRVAELEGG